jgi:hypothetical protein
VFAKMFLRDLAIVGVAAALWWLLAGYSADVGPLADFSGVLVGMAIGLIPFVLHEWGHLLGAVATRSTVQPPTKLATPYLFSFDSKQNSRKQFLAMSFAGWAVSIAVAWAIFTQLPPDLLATRVARGVVVLAIGLIVVIEIPLVLFSLLTGRVPPVETQARPPGLDFTPHSAS